MNSVWLAVDGFIAIAGLITSIWFYRRLRLAGVPLREGRNLDKERHSVLESVLEGLGDACILVDDSMHILFANHETRDLFSIPRNLTGLPLSQLIKDWGILQFIQRVGHSGVKWSEETFRTTLTQYDQEVERYLVVAVAPVKLYGHEHAGHLRIVIRDETDRHETEQIRKDFVANASHELRTPLSIINGYLENMTDGLMDDPALMRKSLLTMQKHGERIARIVEDMLTLSKFESAAETSMATLRGTSFSCGECVADVVDRLAPLIEAKQARMTLQFPEGQDFVQGDRFYWDQIFFNLIENALKENTPGNLAITVSYARYDKEALIHIIDNGVGIPRADLPFIFKRFYRVAKHHSQKIKGTGLGLSIVRRAVESHGGTISVDSTPGKETIFTIRLPDFGGEMPVRPAPLT